MNIEQFERRKRDHIRHALNPAHQAKGLTGLDQIHLRHEALPELDFENVRLHSICLGHEQPNPFFIAGMTAGHTDADHLNERLAHCCSRRGWALGIGSLRRELETGDSKAGLFWRSIRSKMPELLLFANLGITQIIKTSLIKIRNLVESLQVQGLVVHTNPLQECFQSEGTPQFRGAVSKLKELVKSLGLPVILKETGCGFSDETLKRLTDVGLSAIDISGLGGTHWGLIEGARIGEQNPNDFRSEASLTFSQWGEPTAQGVLSAKKYLTGVEIWASGGVRNGLDAAKLIALGADRIGYAQPALQACLRGEEPLLSWMQKQEFELKIALFCTGSAYLDGLRKKEGVWTIHEN